MSHHARGICIAFVVIGIVSAATLGCTEPYPATGKNIIIRGPFDFQKRRDKVVSGMTPQEVVDAIGRPKKMEDDDGVSKWFYTYEFPEKQGQERWAILMVEFDKNHKVSYVGWLPTG